MECPYCQQEYQEEAAVCPHCRKAFQVPHKPQPWNQPGMLNILKNDWKVLLVIVVLALGIPALLSYNTSQKDETVIGQAKLFLAEGYADHEELSEVKWGRVNDAKYLLLKLSENSKVRKEADLLTAEIAARETGMAIVEAQKMTEAELIGEKDIDKGKKIKENLTYVHADNRYYEPAKNMLPEFTDTLDGSLLNRARQYLAAGQFNECRSDLADISSMSIYAYQARLLNDQLCAAETAKKRADEIAVRKQFAKTMEDTLTEKSKMKISVVVSGENSEYLTLKYKAASHGLLKKYADEDKIISNAQALGFKRVTFDTDDSE